jgi:hypothetical protein
VSEQNHSIYEFGPFRLDAQKRLLLRDGEIEGSGNGAAGESLSRPRLAYKNYQGRTFFHGLGIRPAIH